MEEELIRDDTNQYDRKTSPLLWWQRETLIKAAARKRIKSSEPVKSLKERLANSSSSVLTRALTPKNI